MELLPSLKSAKAIALAAATIATAIASSVAPSQAEQPAAFFRPQFTPNTSHYYFEKSNTTFTIGDNCNEVMKLFSGTPFRRVEIFSSTPGRPSGSLLCNSQLPGFTSPAFGSNAGAIVIGNDAFFIKSDAFFKAMKIKPTNLTVQQGKDFIDRHPRINNNVVLETRIAPPVPPVVPAPPVTPPAPPIPGGGLFSFRNSGAYIARYTVRFTVNGTVLEVAKDNIVSNGRASLQVPNGATQINIKGHAQTFGGYKLIFERSYPTGMPASNLCWKTFGTLFTPGLDDNPTPGICN
jgi:hypothetical protein